MSIKKRLINSNNTTLSDLGLAQKLFFEPRGLIMQNLIYEKESTDYSAAEFKLHHLRIKFRSGKITPTKLGQFITFWKRINNGPILPYDLDDPFDFLVVNVRDGDRFGLYVFPKAVLSEKGIISQNKKGGKRAMRIYPGWDKLITLKLRKRKLGNFLTFLKFLKN